MIYSYQTATSDGSLIAWPIRIEYVDVADLSILFNEKAQSPTDPTWAVSALTNTVTFSFAVPAGTTVRLLRATDLEAIRHVFSVLIGGGGSAQFNNQTMDENFQQFLYAAQEYADNWPLILQRLADVEGQSQDALNKATIALANSVLAQSTADAANTKSDTAVSFANLALTAAQAAEEHATEVEELAQQAGNDAAAAALSASAAAASADIAVTTADTALAVANGVDAKADAAVATANAAEATANAIDGKATLALSLADQANTTADTAQTIAQEAMGTAGQAVTTADNALSVANAVANTALPKVSTLPLFDTGDVHLIGVGAHHWDATEGAYLPLVSGGEPLGSTIAWPGQRSSIPGGYIPRDGQEVSQALYPRLYARLVAGDHPTTTEADWQANPNKRGCFVLNSSTGKFRMPDWNGKSPGAIDRVFVSGDGGSAAAPGVIQEDAIQNIVGEFTSGGAGGIAQGAGTTSGAFKPGASKANIPNSVPGANIYAMAFAAENDPNVRTATRARPVNTAGIWITKVADVATNPGTVDVVALAAEASATDAAFQTLDGELDFAIIYPNGGTEANPALISLGYRYLEAHPFPGHMVFCKTQIRLSSGTWMSVDNFIYNSTSVVGIGVRADEFGGNIVVQVGDSAITASSRLCGNAGAITTNITLAVCRVVVWKLKGNLA